MHEFSLNTILILFYSEFSVGIGRASGVAGLGLRALSPGTSDREMSQPQP